MSDISQGPGWWLASDGKWYAHELAPPPSAPPQLQVNEVSELPQRAPSTGHTLGSAVITAIHRGEQNDPHDAPPRAAAPQQMLVSDTPQGEGWWEGTDGKWYAPELYPSETPKGEDWWEASNGKWYAPMFHPNHASRSASPPARQAPSASVGDYAPTGATAPTSGAAPTSATAMNLASTQAPQGMPSASTPAPQNMPYAGAQAQPYTDSAKSKRSFRLHWKKK